MSVMWMGIVVICSINLAVVIVGLHVIAKWDAPIQLSFRQKSIIFAGGLWNGVLVCAMWAEDGLRVQLLASVFAGCLLLASITDSVLCQVHCFVWWIAMAVGGMLWVESNILWSAVSLALFGILQYTVFSRTYGRADCHGFFACALVEASCGAGVEVFFLHMILAYLLLAGVQILKGNVTRRGGLHRPVPFLPYINFSFWVTSVGLLGDIYAEIL